MKIDQQFIESLIREGIPESRTHDYKREFYNGDEKGKHELLKDVSAFANTLGGHIILGVEETAGAVTVPGLDLTRIGKEIERMQSILSTGLEPRAAVEFSAFEYEGSQILVISVPQSYLSPHRVKKDQASYFYLRTGTQAEAMDIQQIRESFTGSDSIFAKARNFHKDRVSKVDSENTSFPLLGTVNLVVHVIPLGSQPMKQLLSAEEFPPHFAMSLYEGLSYPPRNFNLDGCFYAYTGAGKIDMYAQVFRNGAIEIVRSFDRSEGRRFSSPYADGWLIGATYSAITFLRQYHSADYALLISLIGVKGMEFGFNEFHKNKTFDRHWISLPEVVTSETPTDPVTTKQLLQVPREVLFQAAGYREIVES